MRYERSHFFEVDEPKDFECSISERLLSPDARLGLGLSQVEEEQIRDQAELRHDLVREIKEIAIAQNGPHNYLDARYLDNKIDGQLLANFYDHLSELLKDLAYQRLVLYLPKQFLPRLDVLSGDSKLLLSASRFVDAYMLAWSRMLCFSDVRANFIDGDIEESSTRKQEPKRVVKATHLIPWLIDLGYLTDEDLTYLSTPSSPGLAADVAEVVGKLREEGLRESVDFQSIDELLSAFFEDLKKGPIVPSEITARRKAWLHWQFTDGLVSKYSRLAADLEVEIKSFCDLLAQADDRGARLLMLIIENKIVHTWRDSFQAGKNQYSQYSEIIKILEHKHPGLAAELEAKLLKIGLIALKPENIGPRLSGSFSRNLQIFPEITDEVTHALDQLMTSPILSPHFFHAAVVCGSKYKGYGLGESDVDYALFARHSAVGLSRDMIMTELSRVFGDDAPLIFWTRGLDQVLGVSDEPNLNAAGSDSTHFMIGGYWIGEPEAIQGLQAGLIPNYLRVKDTAKWGERHANIERLEQDLLQYRLMHKGYYRHYPSLLSDTDCSRLIDPDSVFWDPGYRLLATTLYLGQVFIPSIDPIKE